MTAPSPALAFDPRPLTEPVDRAAVTAFTRELRATGRIRPGWNQNVVAAVIAVFVLLVFGSMALTIGTSVIGAFLEGGGVSAGFGLVIALFGVLVFGGIVAIFATVLVQALRGESGQRRYRLDRFARANGMSYEPMRPAPALPGLIFGVGGSRQASDLVRGDRPRFVEFANYRYTTGSGKERQIHEWGYVALKLDVPLPHIVLDATSNNGIFGGSNLPASLDRQQRLSLEGDFDRFFSLYCPAGYERDALYLFTPDIMARFIDNAAALDVEIVDDWLFLYARRDLSTLDPAMWAWLFSVVGALLGKLAQWARWRDERLAADASAPGLALPPPAARHPVADPAGASSTRPASASALPFAAPARLLRPPPGVAAPGRRLKRRVPVATIVVMAVFLLLWLFMQVGGLGALSGLLP